MTLRALLLALLALCLAGCGGRSRRMVASGGRDELLERGRLLALGAKVKQPFFSSRDGCISGGSGKLDLRIDCLPNLGTPTMDSIAVDDPAVVEVTKDELGPGPHPGFSYTLHALRVGRTTLRARAHVGLSFSSFAIPLEVVVPDEVTVTGLEAPLFAGVVPPLARHVRSLGREVETGGLPVLTNEGPAALDDSGFHTVEGRGGPGVLRSPYDPRLAAPYLVVTEQDLRATLEVLPGADCHERRVAPRFFAGAREVAIVKDAPRSAQRGLHPYLFVPTPKACELVSFGANGRPLPVDETGAVVRLAGAGTCTVQVGLRLVEPRGDAVVSMHEVRFSPGPCGAPR